MKPSKRIVPVAAVLCAALAGCVAAAPAAKPLYERVVAGLYGETVYETAVAPEAVAAAAAPKLSDAPPAPEAAEAPKPPTYERMIEKISPTPEASDAPEAGEAPTPPTYERVVEKLAPSAAAAREGPAGAASWDPKLLGAGAASAAAALAAGLFLGRRKKGPEAIAVDTPPGARDSRIARTPDSRMFKGAPAASPPPGFARKAPPKTPVAVKTARKELLGRVRVVLEASGCDVDLARKKGKSMIVAAAECGNCEAITMLLEAGADVNTLSSVGESPAAAAQRNGHKEARDLLVAKGGRVVTATPKGCACVVA